MFCSSAYLFVVSCHLSNMRVIIVILCAFLCKNQVCASQYFRHGKWWNLKKSVSVNRPGPPEQWFEQKLDHFDVTKERTWKQVQRSSSIFFHFKVNFSFFQRYFTNDSFFKNDGPVFLMIGGEGEASSEWMVKGTWIELAKKFGALCFQLEHRFYGKSHPTKYVF